VQEAVQVLNMRVPRVLGGAPITPFSLIQGGGGMGSNALQAGQLEQLMRTLGLLPGAMQATAPGDPTQPVLTGAPSPFAAQSRPMGLSPDGTFPGRPPAGRGAPVGITIGATAPAPGLQTGQGPAPPPSMPGEAEQDSQALWDLARRQREDMGRVAY
jgi:hypothetical protein